MVDKERFSKLINEIERHLKHLDELRKIDFETFHSDWRTFDLVNRKLHLVIQAALNLGESIIAEYGFANLILIKTSPEF